LHLRNPSVIGLSNNFDININKTDYNFEHNVYISYNELILENKIELLLK
jgi:hypothetical protein